MLLVFAIAKKTPITSKLYRMQWLIFTTYLMHKNDVIPSNVKDTTDDIRKKKWQDVIKRWFFASQSFAQELLHN